MAPRISVSSFLAVVVISTVNLLSNVEAFHSSSPFPTTQRRSPMPLHSVPDPLDTLSSGLASICRLPNGVTVSSEKTKGDEAPRILQLYDVENSPACRKVRELLTELDLSVDRVIPATPNSRAFTEKTYEYYINEGTELPRMVISAPGSSATPGKSNEVLLSGYEEILAYFEETYELTSEDEDSLSQVKNLVQELAVNVAGLVRIGRGTQVSPAASGGPRKPLVLYSYEGNQFCRLVREVLTELDIVYELRSVGKGSPRRDELAKINPDGSTQCPYLLDPNTNEGILDSAEIVRYLYKNYAKWTPPNELLQWASDNILPLAKPLFATLAPLQAGSRRENSAEYSAELKEAAAKVESTIAEHPVVVYTYEWSPFSIETKSLLASLGLGDDDVFEVSLGKEWIPGLIVEGGAMTRAALLDKTGQSSLPQIFVGGESLGGLYSGTPGLLPSLEDDSFSKLLAQAKTSKKKKPAAKK